MEKIFSFALFLLDVSLDPVRSLGWAELIILLGIVFFLAVPFVAGLVFVLIWFKRRKAGSS